MKESERLARMLDMALAKEAETEGRFGPEGPIGTVVRWRMQFNPGGTWYTFAAIRVSNGWYATAANVRVPRSWSELTAWILAANKYRGWEVWLPTEKKGKGKR